MKSLSCSRGFTMVEMMIVILILGISAAIVVPGVVSLTQGMQLSGAAGNVASQLNLARAKAMATGADQTICFSADSLDSDYHVHDSGGAVAAKWKFSKGITYATVGYQAVTMLASGRAGNSAYIVLNDARGDIDTVSVQASGLVVVYK